jgi:DNA-directed RNA polymerase specialized sigma subunit
MTTKRSPFDKFNRDARPITGGGSNDPHRALWKTWHDSGKKPEHLEPLLDALEPTIQSFAKRKLNGLGGSIPYSALEQQLRIAAKKGLESYDPTRGTKVRTHIITNFQRITDFVGGNRNFAYVPKPRVEKFQRFMNARHEFMEQHGHEPMFNDMKKLLPDIPANDLRPMMSEFRTEHFIGGNPNPDAEDGSLGHAPSQVRSIISLMPALLTSEEQKVFDQLFPTVGDPPSIAQIAKKTGMNQNQVYRLRGAIYKKVKPHLGGV